jgi:hypothetical protein
MLRLAVLLLILANTAYYVWRHDYLATLGLAPAPQSEPQRLAQQIKPELLQVLPAANTPRPLTPASAADASPVMAAPASTAGNTAATECLQVGLFEPAQAEKLLTSLQGLPVGSWLLEEKITPARWVIYMGKYTEPELMTKKRGELRQLGIEFDYITTPALSPGLSLGRFSTKDRADDELARLAVRGVRSAKVVQERPETRNQLLKFPAATAPVRSQLDALKLALLGKPLQPCTPG